LAEPSLETTSNLIAQNRQRLASGPKEILGRDFQQLRRQARESAVQAARDYFRHADEPILGGDAKSLILAGHQPELFHPGVWVKNFALNRIARQSEALPINLVVDNDVAKGTSLTVPAVRVPLPPVEMSPPKTLAVPFDLAGVETPYEERTVQDEALFASLPQRVECEWGFQPLLPAYWEEVLRQAKRTPLLGERIVGARRTFERRWGCHNLELPISYLCRTEPFVWFFCDLLERLPLLHQIYNQTVRHYRRRYRLRSRNHPVPDLAAEGEWLEMPFWGWQTGQPRRGRLLARLRPDTITLRAGNDFWPELGRGKRLAASVLELLQAGHYKIRSRALTNTLYARVFLCDLFVHGLGGGKYDELTDQIIERFYDMQPPGYLVLSATLLLPLPRYAATPDDCRRLGQHARDLHYNPQRHLDAMTGANGNMRALMQRKEELIRQRYSGIWQREQRFAQLKDVTEVLRSYVTAAEQQSRRQLEECRLAVQANAVLANRDFAFCLYPEEKLKPFLTQFL
jgi:hypothetical protein